MDSEVEGRELGGMMAGGGLDGGGGCKAGGRLRVVVWSEADVCPSTDLRK